jgi:hypothetical protein
MKWNTHDSNCGIDRKIKNNYFYHYTKLDILKKIFDDQNGKNVTLLLSDYHYLNDAEEGIYFYNFLRDYKEDIVNIFETDNEKKYCLNEINYFIDVDSYRYRLQEQEDKHFSFSLSELRDSMQFWRQDYANKNGIALCFDKSKFKNFKDKKELKLEKISYFNMDKKILKRFLSCFIKEIKENAERDLEGENHCGSYKLSKIKFWVIKNNVWESEREWRLIKNVSSLSLACEKKLKKIIEFPYKINEDYIPRCEVKIQNPFDEIILGPSIPDYYIGYVQDWLNQNNYKMKVTKSHGHERPKL